MRRRDFLKRAGMFTGVTVLGGEVLLDNSYTRRWSFSRRPDIVFISIEDIAPLMGCYGHPVVKTPNIDALAKRGVVFNNAYCQVAVCNPSRASVSTGLRPETLGVFGNSVDWRRRIPDGMLTLPEYFRDSGYETVICGKIHHHQRYFKDATEQAQQREDRMWNRTLRAKSKAPTKPAIRPQAKRPDWLAEDHYIARSLKWGPTGLTDEQQRDGATAQAVATELRTRHDKPLFMAVGFHSPHYDLRAPDVYFEMYPPKAIALPENPENDLTDVPHKYSTFNTTDDRWLSKAEKRQVIAAYYACISYVDTCVGIIMNALKQAGKEDETIVCLWGDHGMHMGEHFLFRKYTLFENAAHVPLVIAAPGAAQTGRVCNRMVELIDMYPTLTELAGLYVPERLEGASMLPLLQDPDRSWKKAAFTSQSDRNHGLRTEKWRYIEWGDPEHAELYDHKNDPGEFNNLAKDQRYSEVVAELSTLLKSGWKAARP